MGCRVPAEAADVAVNAAEGQLTPANGPPRLSFRQPAPQSSPSALGDIDVVAALDGIGIALAEVADGSSYVWHRRDGKLSGMAQPVGSFKNANGQTCRHLIVMLNTFGRTARIEGDACRSAAGEWLLNG